MAYEVITLNLIPSGEVPVIHAAQYDVNRPLMFALKLGTDDFNPSGYDLELQIRKVDNNIVTVAPASTSGNVVTFMSTEQMTACSGTNLGEIQITKDDLDIATLHFYLVVQRDVLAGGVSSASDIYNLTEQIAEIVPQVIGDDYYNKEEVDEKIAEIPTFDPTNYYNKSQTDALLNDKADVSDLPDMTNYYNKSQTDALLNDKADVSDLPDMTDYYTKSEVDTKITDLYQIKTASGSIVHITDGGNAIPVKSLVSEIVAVQSGSGEKSPTNPYTISGFDSGIVSVCGVNIWNEQWVLGSFLSGQLRPSTTRIRNKYPIPVKPNTTYYFKSPAVACYVMQVDKDSNWTQYDSKQVNLTFTTKPWAKYIYFSPVETYGTIYNNDISINYPSSDTQYHSYNGTTYTFAFGQTVYGGYFDNKGNLVVTHGYIALYNGETINEPWISSMDDYVPNTSPSTGSQVVYPLTTPTTLAITSQDIPTLSGENNIFSNCGDVEVKYFTSKSDGIAELIKAFM